MIENYSNYWSSCCDVYPDEDIRRWSVTQTIVALANAENYYTKAEVDALIAQIEVSGTTPQQVEEMIQAAIASKADKTDLEAFYTKEEVDNKLNNYSGVDDHILYLNNN